MENELRSPYEIALERLEKSPLREFFGEEDSAKQEVE